MEGDCDRHTVRINVNGRMFECLVSTFETFPESRLGKLVLGKTSSQKTSFYFDRSSAMFEHILDSYRTGSVHFPRDVCPSRFIEEMEFWGLVVDDVALCCWKTFCKSEDVSRTMTAMEEHVHVVSTTKTFANREATFRQKMWSLIENPRSSRIAKFWAIWMSIVICTSVMVTSLESVDSFKRNGTEAERKFVDTFIRIGRLPVNKRTDNLHRMPHSSLYVVDMICFLFVTIEHILKVATCPHKGKLFKCALHWLELVAILAIWSSTILNLNIDKLNSNFLMWAMVITNYLRILKLVRLFRITRHMAGFRVIYLTLCMSKHEFSIFAILLFLLTCLFGFTIYVAEFLMETDFDSIFKGLYWAVITLTTVGYGDMIPSTVQGQVVASLCALCGLVVLAMPAGIIVSKFHNYYDHHLYVKRYIETHDRRIS